MAAPTIVQTVAPTNPVTHATTLAVSITGVTAGNTLLVVAVHNNSSGVVGGILNSVTDSNGTGWTVYNDAETNNPPVGVSMATLVNVAAGTHNLTLNLSVDAYCNAKIYELTPCTVDSSSVVAVGATPTATSVSITTVAAQTLVFAFLGVLLSGSNTNLGITDPPTGWTSDAVAQNTTLMYPEFEYARRTTTTAGTYSASWTWTAGNMSNSVAAIAFAGTATGTSVMYLRA